MGFDTTRFTENIDPELICPICAGVMYQPLQAVECEHVYCSQCIFQWLVQQPVCPVDRLPLNVDRLRRVPRIFRNLLGRLTINCGNADRGCKALVKIDDLQKHEDICAYNPKFMIPCKKGCGLTFIKDDFNRHNCITEIGKVVNIQNEKIKTQHRELVAMNTTLGRMENEITSLKLVLQTLRETHPMMHAVFENVEIDQILLWCVKLSRARVLYWGGVIASPDLRALNMVKDALLASGCPPNYVKVLLNHSNEAAWPQAFATPHLRQRNRLLFDEFVFRQVAKMQVVIAIGCENVHMPESLLFGSGMLFIFGQGVEPQEAINPAILNQLG